MTKRRQVPLNSKLQVLTESGYRCAVPTCRTILALDLHHIVEVSEGGGNDPENLIALCPTCHALFHRGEIRRESIQIWKGMLISLSRAFDQDAIDTLLFLDECGGTGWSQGDSRKLLLSPDAVFAHRRLIVAGLVDYWKPSSNLRDGYLLNLTLKGEAVVRAWRSGEKEALSRALLPEDTNTK